MTKMIQAYFRTENEAEGARTSLQVYNTNQLEVGELEGNVGRERHLLFPLVPNNVGTNSSGGTGVAGTGGTQGIPVVPIITDEQNEKADSAEVNGNREGGLLNAENVSSSDLNNLRYVLSCEVKEEEYQDVVNKIRQNNGFVEVFE